MEVSGVKPMSLSTIQNANALSLGSKPVDVSKMSESFSDVLSEALQSVENQEKEVRTLNDQFVTGQISDVHTLMIASEKAQLGLQLTVQVRNKVIEAYQEIMRTQL